MSDIRPYYPPIDYKKTLSDTLDKAIKQIMTEEIEAIEKATEKYIKDGGKLEDLCLHIRTPCSVEHGHYPKELRAGDIVVLRINKPEILYENT